jgi:hypothetical protein
MTEDQFERFAVYYAPPEDSELARVGAEWLGYDPARGVEIDAAEPRGLPKPRRLMVRDARRYGLHATLTAPFRLADGVTPAVLVEAVEALAHKLLPARAPGLEVSDEFDFLTLRPGHPSDAPPQAREAREAALADLARACVVELALLRAPLNASELHRRRRVGLDTVEDANLRRWGYPYVLDRYRFHITLTGPLASTEARVATPVLKTLFEPALEPDFLISELALFGDPGGGAAFKVLRRFPLQGA